MKNKTLLYIFSFFGQFYPIYPLYGLMFSEVGNLSSSQIASLFFLWFLFALIWEIPTGIIADKFSRRNSVIFGYISTILTFLIWLVFPTYLGFLVGFLLWGLGYALISGAWDAYLYTLLEKTDEEKDYIKYVGRLESVGYIGMVFAYLLSAILIQFGYDLVLIISIVIGSISPMVLLFLPRDNVENTNTKGQIQILKDAHKQVATNPKLSAVMFSIAVLGGFIGTIEEYIPLYYAWNGVSTQMVANILFIALVLSSLISWIIHRFEWMNIRQINITIVFLGIGMFATDIFGGWIAVLGIFVTAMIWYGLQTLQYAQMQRIIKGDERATVSSLATFQAEILALCFLSTYWIMSNFVSDPIAVYGIGLLLSLAFLTRLFYKKD